jgi:hypothetical protein
MYALDAPEAMDIDGERSGFLTWIVVRWILCNDIKTRIGSCKGVAALLFLVISDSLGNSATWGTGQWC